jgi:hypothetical protein
MAKRRTVSLAPYRAQAQVIQLAPPRRRTSIRRVKHRRRRSSSAGGGSAKNVMLGLAIGGAALGFIEKSSFAASLPTLPVIGRTGSIALGIYFFNKNKPGLVRDIGCAAAVLAGYQLGHDGKISGEDG